MNLTYYSKLKKKYGIQEDHNIKKVSENSLAIFWL